MEDGLRIIIAFSLSPSQKFNGLVYPKGLSKNSSCMTEYIQEESTIVYVLTLRSCNTMSTDVVSTVMWT